MKTHHLLHRTIGLAGFICLTCMVSGQGLLLPPGPPSAPAVTLEQLAPAVLLPDPQGRTGLAAAPFRITEPGHYRLAENIFLESATAIVIASSFVTLDLAGQIVRITGSAPAAAAIQIDSSYAEAGVVIRNGTIRGRFERAIHVLPMDNGAMTSMVRVEDLWLHPEKTEVSGILQRSVQGGIVLGGALSRIVRCHLVVREQGSSPTEPYPFIEGNRIGAAVGRGGIIDQVELQGAALAAASGSYVSRIGIHRYSDTPRDEAALKRPALTLGHGCVARQIFIDTSTAVLDAGSAIRLDDVFVSDRWAGNSSVLSAALITRFAHPAGFSGRMSYHDALRVDQSELRGSLVPYQDARYAHLTRSQITKTPGDGGSITLSLPRGSLLHACGVTGGEVGVYGAAGSPLFPPAHVRMTDSRVTNTSLTGVNLPVASVLIGNRLENLSEIMVNAASGTLVRRNVFANTAGDAAGTALALQGSGIFVVENDFRNLSRVTAHGVLEKLPNTVAGPLVTAPVWNADLSAWANTYHSITVAPVP